MCGEVGGMMERRGRSVWRSGRGDGKKREECVEKWKGRGEKWEGWWRGEEKGGRRSGRGDREKWEGWWREVGGVVERSGRGDREEVGGVIRSRSGDGERWA